MRALVGTDAGHALDVYRFHQERAETIRSRLWTILAWLAAAQGAILAFTVKELSVGVRLSPGVQIAVGQPPLVLALALLGIALSRYMLAIIDDGSRHIESNWRRADLGLGMACPHRVEEDAAKRRRAHPVCKVMAGVASATCFAHSLLALLSAVVIAVGWTGVELPFLVESERAAVPR